MYAGHTAVLYRHRPQVMFCAPTARLTVVLGQPLLHVTRSLGVGASEVAVAPSVLCSPFGPAILGAGCTDVCRLALGRPTPGDGEGPPPLEGAALPRSGPQCVTILLPAHDAELYFEPTGGLSGTTPVLAAVVFLNDRRSVQLMISHDRSVATITGGGTARPLCGPVLGAGPSRSRQELCGQSLQAQLGPPTHAAVVVPAAGAAPFEWLRLRYAPDTACLPDKHWALGFMAKVGRGAGGAVERARAAAVLGRSPVTLAAVTLLPQQAATEGPRVEATEPAILRALRDPSVVGTSPLPHGDAALVIPRVGVLLAPSGCLLRLLYTTVQAATTLLGTPAAVVGSDRDPHATSGGAHLPAGADADDLEDWDTLPGDASSPSQGAFETTLHYPDVGLDLTFCASTDTLQRIVLRARGACTDGGVWDAAARYRTIPFAIAGPARHIVHDATVVPAAGPCPPAGRRVASCAPGVLLVLASAVQAPDPSSSPAAFHTICAVSVQPATMADQCLYSPSRRPERIAAAVLAAPRAGAGIVTGVGLRQVAAALDAAYKPRGPSDGAPRSAPVPVPPPQAAQITQPQAPKQSTSTTPPADPSGFPDEKATPVQNMLPIDKPTVENETEAVRADEAADVLDAEGGVEAGTEEAEEATGEATGAEESMSGAAPTSPSSWRAIVGAPATSSTEEREEHEEHEEQEEDARDDGQGEAPTDLAEDGPHTEVAPAGSGGGWDDEDEEGTRNASGSANHEADDHRSSPVSNDERARSYSADTVSPDDADLHTAESGRQLSDEPASDKAFSWNAPPPLLQRSEGRAQYCDPRASLSSEAPDPTPEVSPEMMPSHLGSDLFDQLSLPPTKQQTREYRSDTYPAEGDEGEEAAHELDATEAHRDRADSDDGTASQEGQYSSASPGSSPSMLPSAGNASAASQNKKKQQAQQHQPKKKKGKKRR